MWEFRHIWNWHYNFGFLFWRFFGFRFTFSGLTIKLSDLNCFFFRFASKAIKHNQLDEILHMFSISVVVCIHSIISLFNSSIWNNFDFYRHIFTHLLAIHFWSNRMYFFFILSNSIQLFHWVIFGLKYVLKCHNTLAGKQDIEN